MPHGDSIGIMAAIKLEPPEPFDFKKPELWTRWIKQFDQYRIASGLSDKDLSRQVCVLLYTMGSNAKDVLMSIGVTNDNRKDYQKVADKFYKVRQNIILEKARFNRRDQLSGEIAEEYITVLYSMIDASEYDKKIKDKMLRDRLVVRIRDKGLSEKLQMDAKINMETAKTTICQREAVKEQQSLLLPMPEGTKANPIT